jgi:Fe-S cluster assembly iron-binding protein IscA
MLLLTENASEAVHAIFDESTLPDGAGLRIATPPDGSEALTVAPVPAAERGDQVIEEHGARVFVEAEAAALLDDLVLDAHVDDDGRVQFVLGPQ